VSELGKELDYQWEDSKTVSVSHGSLNGKSEVVAGRWPDASRYIGRCDAWARALLVLNVPHTNDSIPFEELVERATRVTEVSRRALEGNEAILVRLNFDSSDLRPASWEVEIYFDPAVNYLVKRAVYIASTDAGKYRRQTDVAQFKECTPGVFFPERLFGEDGPVSKPNFKHTTIISDIHVNEKLPQEIFHFRFPDGIQIHDKVRGALYRIDSQGKAISKETPMEVFSPPPPAVDSVIYQTETQEEPPNPRRWIVPLSLLALALGGGGVLVRRMRRAAPTH